MAEVIAELVGRLTFELDDKGSKKAKEALGDLGKESDKAGVKAVALGTILGNLAVKTLELAAAAGQAALALGEEMVVGFADAGMEADKWARTLGTTTQEVQRLEFAGQSVGAEADNVHEAIKTLRENLGEMARVGSGPAVDALGSLGLQLDDIKDLGATEQLQLFATALNEVKDPSKQLSIALEILGEDGRALLPLFQQGAGAFDALGDKAESLGLVMSDQAVGSALALRNAWVDLSATGRGALQGVIADLAPVLTEVIGNVTQWISANKALISQRIQDFVEGVAEAVASLARNFDTIMLVGSEVLTWAGRLATVFISARVATAAYAVVAGGIPAIMTAIKTTTAAMSLAIGGLPGVIGAAVAALGILIMQTNAAREAQERFNEARMDLATSQQQRSEKGQEAQKKLQDLREKGRLGDLPETEYARLLEDYSGLLAIGVDEQGRRFSEEDVERRLSAFDRERDRQGLIARRKDAEARAGEARKRAKEREKFERQAKDKGGKSKEEIDTVEAYTLFGDELVQLARAAGVGEKAIQAGLEAAAKSLESGAAPEVARQAAVGQISSLSGVDFQAGGIDAALFGALTQVGGPQAAASAAAGARFVSITNTWNFTNTFELALPDGFGTGLQADSQGVAVEMNRMLTEQWTAVMDRFGQGLEP